MNEELRFEQRVNVKLFGRVMEQIEAEPQRFCMSVFFAGRGWVTGQEECKTAACIAGWAIALADKEGVAKYIDAASWRVLGRAGNALGITKSESERLFFDDKWPEPLRGAYLKMVTAGDRADIAVQRIKYFLQTKGQ
jgi:hypothetical protein